MRYRNPETDQLLDAPEEDYEGTWKAQGFVPVDGTPVPGSDGPDATAPVLTGPSEMTRDELNAHASSVGILDPTSFPNKAALIEAIEVAEAGQPPQE